jgi:cytochrome P450
MSPILLAVGLITFTYVLLKYRKRAIGSTPLPYGPLCEQVPGALPLVGNLIMGVLNMNRLNEYALEKALEEIQVRDPNYEKFATGGTRCISVPFMPCFLFVHLPEHIQHIMHKKFARYVKGTQWQNLAYPVFQRGWLVTDGGDWQISRKIIVNIFKSAG